MKIDTATSTPLDRRDDRLLRFPEVHNRTGLSESTIRRREARGTFPGRVALGPRLVGWYESDVVAWVRDPIGYQAGKPALA
ncbi:transcriptional regulator, AlpA family [Sphingomonas rubra]|uniref:Transcriptional regulator, AlpA family n=2 Tax=Sphingomonas rubra TaxID=634430 RepID=A0A1I5RVM2_9SPHN|nr:transcriptional regulator, AlpA family [Sphingomonas rubra]